MHGALEKIANASVCTKRYQVAKYRRSDHVLLYVCFLYALETRKIPPSNSVSTQWKASRRRRHLATIVFTGDRKLPGSGSVLRRPQILTRLAPGLLISCTLTMKSIIGSLLLLAAIVLASGAGVASYNPQAMADPLATSGRMSSLVWQKNGCHRVGHTRRISIPDCVEFHMTTNACRGYCESWSIPSSPESLAKNPAQLVTSIGQCCNIMETEDVTARIMCVDGPRELTFKSAKSCACFHCKKN